MRNEKIVFYDHNCKICICFSVWVKNRTNYWDFLPNDVETVRSKNLGLDEGTVASKLVCIDGSVFYGGIAVLKIYSKCGGILSLLSKFFLSLKFIYPLYFLVYYLVSKNRTKFSFLIKFINC